MFVSVKQTKELIKREKEEGREKVKERVSEKVCVCEREREIERMYEREKDRDLERETKRDCELFGVSYPLFSNRMMCGHPLGSLRVFFLQNHILSFFLSHKHSYSLSLPFSY